VNAFATRLRWLALGAVAAGLVLGGAGSAATGDNFILGRSNSAGDQTTLTASIGSPVLRVSNNGTAAALRGDAQSGIGINGVSVTGTGAQGQSQAGIGVLGQHTNATGVNPGVQGATSSTDPNGAGVVGRNTGGGPGLKAIVNAGVPPLSVNSDAKVEDLNSDLIDGLDSSAFWKLGGNAGTTPATDVLGTTDSQPLIVKTNGIEAMRIAPGSGGNPGGIGVGWYPNANTQLFAWWRQNTPGTGLHGDEGGGSYWLRSGTGVLGRGSRHGIVGQSNDGTGVVGEGGRPIQATAGEVNTDGFAMGARGNAWQTRTRGGWVKAMYDSSNAGERCFRGDEAAQPTTANSCTGFSRVVGPNGAGESIITFPFQVNDRFVVVTPRWGGLSAVTATYEFPGSNQIQVRTWRCNADGCALVDSAFSLVVF
jgi:hypothetical protein